MASSPGQDPAHRRQAAPGAGPCSLSSPRVGALLAVRPRARPSCCSFKSELFLGLSFDGASQLLDCLYWAHVDEETRGVWDQVSDGTSELTHRQILGITETNPTFSTEKEDIKINDVSICIYPFTPSCKIWKKILKNSFSPLRLLLHARSPPSRHSFTHAAKHPLPPFSFTQSLLAHRSSSRLPICSVLQSSPSILLHQTPNQVCIFLFFIYIYAPNLLVLIWVLPKLLIKFFFQLRNIVLISCNIIWIYNVFGSLYMVLNIIISIF